MRRRQLEAALGAYQPTFHPPMPGRTNHIAAGILVPILGEDEPRVVLTERPATMRHHASEICFPGGRPEPGDVDLAATAVREAREEIGLAEARIVGRLSSVPLFGSDHRLEPFVAFADDVELVPNPGEVARLIVFSLTELLARPFIDGIEWNRDGLCSIVPVFDTGPRFLFGGTAAVLYELLQVIAPAFGTKAPDLRAGRYTWDEVLPR